MSSYKKSEIRKKLKLFTLSWKMFENSINLHLQIQTQIQGDVKVLRSIRNLEVKKPHNHSHIWFTTIHFI